ncbi:VWA domain-containing protein [Demequina salsinemoris]|uniref:VWA domain-containing protein n=1 Tax=Demequina salsinemoris TaxID=577470 RepID=UPI000781CFEA|nr:VWA domain-containing protein [Demequina salsinemoris]
MTFLSPWMLLAAAVAVAALTAGAVVLARRRRRALAAAGIPTRRSWAPQVPTALLIAGVGLLLVSSARPQAVITLPRAAGTVVIAIDTSASMTADDVSPSRLEAAQEAASEIVEAQASSVDVGVVAFSGGALSTQLPSEDHTEAIAAIASASSSGSTSLGQAILTALSAITGETVTLDGSTDDGTTDDGTSTLDGTDAQAADYTETSDTSDLGYWGSATIVLISDGEQTSDPDAIAAAELAAELGVHVETVGVGTTEGTTIEVDGYTASTALDEELLTEIAATTGGSYHALSDVSELDDVASSLDLRVTVQEEERELTPFLAALALALLVAGAGITIVRTGRLL